MTTSAGRWVSVRFPDGRVRFDWVPSDQPPPPRGQRGYWHVVHGGPRQPTRWEWHADPEPVRRGPRTTAPPPIRPSVRVEPNYPQPPPAMPALRPEATVEVLPDKVYRHKRSMGVWFWLGAVILAAIGGAGAVAVTSEKRDEAKLTAGSNSDKKDAAETKPVDDTKPTKAGLERVAQGYLTALLAGNTDEMLSYLDPACDGADPGFAMAARWASSLADGATITVEEIEMKGRRGSVTDFDLVGIYGSDEDKVRKLITDETVDGEQSFPYRFTDGEWYYRGECGGTTFAGSGTSPSDGLAVDPEDSSDDSDVAADPDA